MALEVRILTGALGGTISFFEKPTVVVGRSTDSDLKFDAKKDLDVSGKHAEFRGSGTRYEIHDLGSTNGTFLNGKKVEGSAPLKNGDRIQFGADGPTIEVMVRPTAAMRAQSGGVRAQSSTEERVAFAVKKQTAGMRQMLIAAMVLVVVGLGAAYYIGQRASSQQVERLRQQIAESDARVAALQTGLAGDTSLGNEMQRRLGALRSRLVGATSEQERTRLTTEIAEIEGKVAGIVRMDVPAINAKNAPGVALLVSKFGERQFAGTAFAITPGGLMLTNQHNVKDRETGAMTKALAIKFRDSKDWIPATVVKYANDPDAEGDLALIQLDTAYGPFPLVAGVQPSDDNAGEGASVVTIGFPFGYSTVQEGVGNDFVAKTTLNGGMVSKRTTSVLQIDSFAGHGSSGSPVFSARGLVVGVIFGGQADAGGRIVYAVPPEKIVAFLPPELRSAVVKN